MKSKKVIDNLVLCMKNGWECSFAKSTNEDGTECELLNLELYEKKFQEDVYSFELRRFVGGKNESLERRGITEPTMGWLCNLYEVNDDTAELEKKKFYEPNSYLQAIEYMICKIGEIEGKYIKQLAEKNIETKDLNILKII